MSLAAVLPLAFVMIAGPQIISAFFFATSEDWKRDLAAYVLGAALSMTAIVSARLLARRTESRAAATTPASTTIDYVVLAPARLRDDPHLSQPQARPSRRNGWASCSRRRPKTRLLLGFLLLGFFPSDLVTSISVGSPLANDGDAWWHVFPSSASPCCSSQLRPWLVALLGSRAQTLLPKVRDWMNTNSWIISEVVIVFFIAIVLSG